MKFITEVPLEEPVHVIEAGDRFLMSCNTYILAQTQAGIYALIDIKTGNRWNDPCPMEEVAKTLNKEKAVLLSKNDCNC